MAKVYSFNTDGKKGSAIDVNDAVFAVQKNDALVHQVYVSLRSNARQPWAHAKDRSAVRGGGRKPWQQKGTGRARHGSNRSPIWKGGGVTFGPMNIQNWKKRVNRKMKRKAVVVALSAKVASDQLILVDALPTDGKAKTLAVLRQALPGNGKTTLIIDTENNQQLQMAARNIDRVNVQQAADVNVVDLLHHQFVITNKAGIDALDARLA